MTADEVALAAQAACVLEVSAPKPGNVNRAVDFADTRFDDFLLSALAIGPAFRRADRDPLGRVILNAVRATQATARTNTNLGMVLLLAPLTKACFGASDLRANTEAVLAQTTVDDARDAYAAIRHARAGGLGQVGQADIAAEPEISLRAAMALAQDRDAIASEYATGFAITFDTGYPALAAVLQAAGAATGEATGELSRSIVQTFLTLLAAFPDTLIARKLGSGAAAEVSRGAARVLELGGVMTAEGRSALAAFDHELRDDRHALNPGTTADLTAAAVFVHLMRERRFRPVGLGLE